MDGAYLTDKVDPVLHSILKALLQLKERPETADGIRDAIIRIAQQQGGPQTQAGSLAVNAAPPAIVFPQPAVTVSLPDGSSKSYGPGLGDGEVEDVRGKVAFITGASSGLG
jgi:hypothetical protein